jgi:hypothetical protein
MKFQKSIKQAYNKKVPKKTRQKIAKVWKSEEGNRGRKNIVHRINRGMAKHKDAAIATMATAGGAAGGYVGGPEGAAIGAFLAEKYGRKAYEAGQKLGAGQERRIDRRINRGFSEKQKVTPKVARSTPKTQTQTQPNQPAKPEFDLNSYLAKYRKN